MSADLRARIAELEAEIELLAIDHRSLNQASIEALERAEQAEAEVERLKAERARWRSMAGVAEVEAERDRLREELRLARFDKERAEATVARLRVLRDDYWRLPGCSEIGDDLDAALDQAPAAEQVKRTIEEALDIIDGQFAEDRAAEQDGGGQ